MNLTKRGQSANINCNIVARISKSAIFDPALRKDTALLYDEAGIQNESDLSGYAILISEKPIQSISLLDRFPLIHSVKDIGTLSDGDVILIRSNANYFRVMYRIDSKHNVIFTTDACNSNCLMCSQPPKDVDPNEFVPDILNMLKLIDPCTQSMGITGGEPLLLGENIFKIISECKDLYPSMDLHMLSNGRLFKNENLAKAYARINHPRLMVGIPLYSDIDSLHDYVVQAKGAFFETISGIHNLGKHKQKIEIRVVIHKQTYERLPELARFIYKNMPFVDHIALMGMEIVGYVKANYEALWIDPYDYQDKLFEATQYLAKNNMNVSIYNHQLCVLDRRLWKFAKSSISDWKNAYSDECEKCDVLGICGGFFQWNPTVRSGHIKAISF